MNTLKNCHKFIPVLLVLSPSLLWSACAEASSSFNSAATISYTINSITNLNHTGSFADLAISGTFDLAAAPDYSVTLSGDGTIVGNNVSIEPVAINPSLLGKVFSHAFSVSGSTGNGTANTSQLGLFGLNFQNTGSDDYEISVTLNYQLNSTVAGALADSTVALDYYNDNQTNPFGGMDRIDTSAFLQDNAEIIGTSDVFNFTLAAGTSEIFHADVNITGNLEASPVPLPASFWLLFAGLSSIVSIGKGRRQQA